MKVWTAGGWSAEGALVELGQDGVARAVQQVGGDLCLALGEAGVVQLAADQAEQRGLDLGASQVGAAGDEAHDGLGHGLADEVRRRARARRPRPAARSCGRGACGSA
jgi:hypothetical protein